MIESDYFFFSPEIELISADASFPHMLSTFLWLGLEVFPLLTGPHAFFVAVAA